MLLKQSNLCIRKQRKVKVAEHDRMQASRHATQPTGRDAAAADAEEQKEQQEEEEEQEDVQ